MPHPSTPAQQTGWVKLGVVSTDTAGFAIVAPEIAAILGDDWCAKVEHETSEDLVQFEQVNVGEHDTAVLFSTGSDGGYLVQGRFGSIYGDDDASLIEVRIRIWWCECTCHEHEEDDDNCDGSCHDADPASAGNGAPLAS